jgi:hypothetical protein
MADDSTLEMLRKDAIQRRIKGFAGANRIHWAPKDIAAIIDHGKAMRAEMFRTTPAFKLKDERKAENFNEAGFAIKNDAQPEDLNFLFRVSSSQVDLANDVIQPAGIDCSIFNQNPAVLNSHDSSVLPIATSSVPWVSGNSLMAIAKFPQLGVNANSDQVAAAIRAKLVRGASIGFIPISYSFSKDPARPFGVDFKAVKITEWSCCSVPCNSECLLIGAVSGKSVSEINTMARRLEARSLTANARRKNDDVWQCCAVETMPIDASDDSFDPTLEKARLLAQFSPNGTIVDEARDYFFASNISSPLDASSYSFPFCRANGATVVASKVGWRQSFAALEKSNMPGLVISQARAVVERLELRLGDIKSGPRPQLTRDQRIAEARNFRRMAESVKSF